MKVIASMASGPLLNNLFQHYQKKTGNPVDLQVMGGVTAEKRLQQGEAVDIAILSSAAIDRLQAEAILSKQGKTDLFRSETVMAVQAGNPHPSIHTEEALRSVVLSARSIGYSSGPSGAAIAALFDTWGISEQVSRRIVVPPPGTAVGLLLAQGKIELGFQQLAELKHVEGVEVVGPLPGPINIESIFSAAISPFCKDWQRATELLQFLCLPQNLDAIRHHGMEPASLPDL